MGLYPDYSKIQAVQVSTFKNSDDPEPTLINASTLQKGIELYLSLLGKAEPHNEPCLMVKVPTLTTYSPGSEVKMMWMPYPLHIYFHLLKGDTITTLQTDQFPKRHQLFNRLCSALNKADPFVFQWNIQSLRKDLFLRDGGDLKRVCEEGVGSRDLFPRYREGFPVAGELVGCDGVVYGEMSWDVVPSLRVPKVEMTKN